MTKRRSTHPVMQVRQTARLNQAALCFIPRFHWFGLWKVPKLGRISLEWIEVKSGLGTIQVPSPGVRYTQRT
jgi:hypothetical protein